MKSIVSVFIFLIIFSNVNMTHAYDPAKGNDGYCAMAQTTSDLVQCSKTHLEVKTQRLNELYDVFNDIVRDEDLKQAVIAGQQEWLMNYQTVCDNEKQALAGGSLAVVQDLTCRAREMDNRVIHFESLVNAIDPKMLPVYANPPRWMNVLGAQYNDVFWNLASRETIDTDCDGVDEGVIQGLRKTQGVNGYHIIWAIADSERTGRPMISLINFKETMECELLSGIEYSVVPNAKPMQDGLESPKTCYGRLFLNTKNCGRFTIAYDLDTKSYNLIEEKEEETVNDE